MGFWDLRHLETTDPLNEEIWAASPVEQAAIQAYRGDWQDGEIGAQQAMRSPWRLPWVPDLIGTNWRSRDAIIVVGSAYAPFIRNAHGEHEMSADDYCQPTAAEFQRRFVEQVVIGRKYYTEVATLAEHAVSDASHLVLLDLCRAALVRRGSPRDLGGDGVVNAAPELYSQYVENAAPRRWLWDRMSDSAAHAVIALGTIAEHGLLRLFSTSLHDVRIRDSSDDKIRFASPVGPRWPAYYASRHRTITARSQADRVPCWVVTGVTRSGERRHWHIAVVPHPTGARQKHPGYTRRAVLTAYQGDA